MNGPGRLAQLACVLEVIAPKPGNVHRSRDLPGLHLIDFIASALAIGQALDCAATGGLGLAVEKAIEATHQLVATNTNLGMVLLLAPLVAVPEGMSIRAGVPDVLAATTIDDARAVYRAIRRARPGGLGSVRDQDISQEPTLTLKAVMASPPIAISSPDSTRTDSTRSSTTPFPSWKRASISVDPSRRPSSRRT